MPARKSKVAVKNDPEEKKEAAKSSKRKKEAGDDTKNDLDVNGGTDGIKENLVQLSGIHNVQRELKGPKGHHVA